MHFTKLRRFKVCSTGRKGSVPRQRCSVDPEDEAEEREVWVHVHERVCLRLRGSRSTIKERRRFGADAVAGWRLLRARNPIFTSNVHFRPLLRSRRQVHRPKDRKLFRDFNQIQLDDLRKTNSWSGFCEIASLIRPAIAGPEYSPKTLLIRPLGFAYKCPSTCTEDRTCLFVSSVSTTR